jgi:glutamate racemase
MAAMEHDSRPIGMFDSGVGGLSVLAEVRARLPAESVLYVADQRWAPYGDRTLAEVRRRAVQLSGQLIEAGAKAVVVACNSASAAALTELRRVYPTVPFVGMEPAVKPAALASRTGVVGVVATSATFQGELFASVVDRHANGAVVLTGAPSGLVELIEAGREDSPETQALLAGVVTPMLAQGMDTLVLGCTHYAFVRETLARIVGADVAIIDPAPAVARQVARVLLEAGRTARPDAVGAVTYHTTLDPASLASAVGRLMGAEGVEAGKW